MSSLFDLLKCGPLIFACAISDRPSPYPETLFENTSSNIVKQLVVDEMEKHPFDDKLYKLTGNEASALQYESIPQNNHFHRIVFRISEAGNYTFLKMFFYDCKQDSAHVNQTDCALVKDNKDNKQSKYLFAIKDKELP